MTVQNDTAMNSTNYSPRLLLRHLLPEMGAHPSICPMSIHQYRLKRRVGEMCSSLLLLVLFDFRFTTTKTSYPHLTRSLIAVVVNSPSTLLCSERMQRRMMIFGDCVVVGQKLGAFRETDTPTPPLARDTINRIFKFENFNISFPTIGGTTSSRRVTNQRTEQRYNIKSAVDLQCSSVIFVNFRENHRPRRESEQKNPRTRIVNQ